MCLCVCALFSSHQLQGLASSCSPFPSKYGVKDTYTVFGKGGGEGTWGGERHHKRTHIRPIGVATDQLENRGLFFFFLLQQHPPLFSSLFSPTRNSPNPPPKPPVRSHLGKAWVFSVACPPARSGRPSVRSRRPLGSNGHLTQRMFCVSYHLGNVTDDASGNNAVAQFFGSLTCFFSCLFVFPPISFWPPYFTSHASYLLS